MSDVIEKTVLSAGFGRLMDEFEQREHGRTTTGARWAGITPGGFLRALERGTLKTENMEALAAGIEAYGRSRGWECSREGISRFLSGLGPWPLTKGRAEGAMPPSEAWPALLCLHKIAEKKGINLMSKLSSNQLDEIVMKLRTVEQQGVPTDSAVFKDLAELLLTKITG